MKSELGRLHPGMASTLLCLCRYTPTCIVPLELAEPRVGPLPFFHTTWTYTLKRLPQYHMVCECSLLFSFSQSMSQNSTENLYGGYGVQRRFPVVSNRVSWEALRGNGIGYDEFEDGGSASFGEYECSPKNVDSDVRVGDNGTLRCPLPEGDAIIVFVSPDANAYSCSMVIGSSFPVFVSFDRPPVSPRRMEESA